MKKPKPDLMLLNNFKKSYPFLNRYLLMWFESKSKKTLMVFLKELPDFRMIKIKSDFRWLLIFPNGETKSIGSILSLTIIEQTINHYGEICITQEISPFRCLPTYKN